MHSSSFNTEVDFYVAATRNFRLREERAFDAFTRFASDVISLIRDRWPSEGDGWLDVVHSCRNGSLSDAQVRRVQLELTSYRKNELHEPCGMDVEHSDQAAIVFLFQLAIEMPPPKGSVAYRGTSLVRALDEFSVEFIEHFGMAEAVVTLAKRHFD